MSAYAVAPPAQQVHDGSMVKRARKLRNELLKQVLTQEVERLSALSPHDLRRQLPEPLNYELVAQGLTCHLEVQVLEDESDCVHVGVSVCGGSLLRYISPMSTSIIVHTDGRVDR